MVATAFFLGAHWLGTPILGIPLGVWGIPLVFAVVRWGEHISIGGKWGSRLCAMPVSVMDRVRTFCRETTGSIRKSVEEIRAAATPRPSSAEQDPVQLSLFEDPGDSKNSNRRKFGRKGSQIRIGVSTSPSVTTRLVSGERPLGFEWIALEPGAGTPIVAERMELDALVHDAGEGELVITTFGAEDSGITDWSKPSEATYAGVFPSRLDPKRCVLGELKEDDALQIEFFRALAEAAAASARSTADALSGIRRITGEFDIQTRAMLHLRDLVVRAALRPHAPGSAMTAARVLTGWLSTWDGPIDAEDRLEGFEAAARLAPDDPAVQLRLAAARLAALEDASGIEAIRRADMLVRGMNMRDLPDPLPFVQSELECGLVGDTMIVGRIASGLCLAAATSPGSVLAYLEEDVLDDMRYSPVLIGRDPDRLLLMKVLRELQRLHRASGSATQAA
ncbi:MAG: hypothetical protein KF866_12790 [Phycisphaeraceae bacterium]|nr:hypothetical protein [Phycisphaeraceae bacterium]